MLKVNIEINNKTIIVTGAAGFIGYHLIVELLNTFSNMKIIGIDNICDYYDTSLKEKRLLVIKECVNKNKTNEWIFVKGSIVDKEFVENIFNIYKPSIVVHLAAQAGVRYSITNPDIYINTNLIGFYNIIVSINHC